MKDANSVAHRGQQDANWKLTTGSQICTSPPPSSSNAHQLSQLLPLISLIQSETPSCVTSGLKSYMHISPPPLNPHFPNLHPQSIMKITAVIFLFFFDLVFLNLVSCDSPPNSALQSKCSNYFTNLGQCLSYASAKADEPSSACCGSVGEIRQKDPVCLCFIIQQVHGGNSAATGMGLQLDRLLKLPAACKLANADISNCPKLLNLQPNSPDYAIFSNSTTKASATPSGSSSGSSSSSNVRSTGVTNKIQCPTVFIVTVISAAFGLSIF